ncbi:Uncharacterised protein [uncultured Flavonifractor sp.]|nr:Uncharacterised protein [Flavonifractor plautii]SCJ23278.1 Uncharacterised protein [uncultured Flavonifractor sp.]
MSIPKRKALCEADKKLLSLAEKIAKAGKIIAGDSINKNYLVFHNLRGEITVTSDSGFEAILIGNTERGSRDGFMYLFFKNTAQQNSYPSVDKIAASLRQVVLEKRLPEGEGKATYHDWKEYGGMERQLRYFSELVCELAGITPQEVSCISAGTQS